MTEDHVLNPSFAELYEHGHAAVDQVVAYLSSMEERPVLSRQEAGALRRALPASPPQEGESLETILADVERLIVPGLTQWQSPGFMAYFGTTGSVAGIIGELLSAGFNVNAMLWRTSPAATELEQVAVDWLRQLMGLPAQLFGCINDTASSSTLYALAAAREAIPGADIGALGLAGRPELGRLRYYASEEAHSSVEKAGMLIGTGRAGLRRIAVNDRYQMDVAALEHAIAEDRDSGWLPFAVVATVGTTSTTSIDPVGDIAAVCERHGLWLHVDAAYGGVAAIVPELHETLRGCERADSLVVNPHKWLLTPLDCSVLYTRRPDMLRRAFSLVPEYLTSSDENQDDVVNLMDYGIALGRRFRALKLWMVLRHAGAEGLVAHIREHVRLAKDLAKRVESTNGWELLAPVPLSVVCMRAHPHGLDDEAALERLNARILDDVNARGHCFLSHTKVRGRYAIRVAIGNQWTEERHVRGVWEELADAARRAAAAR